MRPDFFVLGLSLPLAVCAAFGFERWLSAAGNRRGRRIVLTLSVCGLLLFEYWNGEYPGFDPGVSPFYTELAQETDPFALIDLPMGRSESKQYLYLQTIHHHPLIEGLVARTPPEAYDYINGNPLLARWKNHQPLDCQEMSASTIKQSIDQLVTDGFRYVIIHLEGVFAPQEEMSYFNSPPIYDDGRINVYAIADLQTNPPCKSQ